MLRCSTCQKLKPVDSFFRNKATKNGRSNQCKDCHTVSLRPSQLRNRATLVKASERARKLRCFGLTQADYDAMIERQGNLCAICGKPETIKDRQCGKLKALAVDHCHKTGSVRGLLCQRCNFGLGLFFDDAEVLGKAIAYLIR